MPLGARSGGAGSVVRDGRSGALVSEGWSRGLHRCTARSSFVALTSASESIRAARRSLQRAMPPFYTGAMSEVPIEDLLVIDVDKLNAAVRCGGLPTKDDVTILRDGTRLDSADKVRAFVARLVRERERARTVER